MIGTGDADGGGVVGELVLWLHDSVVLGGVTGEREPFQNGLLPDAWTEARQPYSAALLHFQGEGEPIKAVASVGVVDGACAESASDRATGGRVGWSRTPTRLAGSMSIFRGWLVA